MNSCPSPHNAPRKTLQYLAVIAACAAAVSPAQVMAHNEPRTQGYLVDSRGELVRSGAGLCWRTGYWTPEMAIEECDPELVKHAAAPVNEVTPVPGVAPERIKYCTTLDIQFEIDRYAIQHEYEASVERLGAYLRRYPDTTAVIEGHTDEVGSDEYNMQLSQRRANSVVDYLVARSGIDRSRLKAVGYGKTRPVADNRTEEGKRQNRRIDSVIDCALDVKEGFKPVPGRITKVALDMEFDRNRADIKPRYHDELARVADFLKENPNASATIEGHAGNAEGTPAHGMELSQRRAESVVKYLTDKLGIERNRLSAAGFGQTRRVAYSWSEEGRRENRRVNIYIDYAK
ncbi:MAG TPA: OmpA family protein [Gallionella sp.]|nr:OmpA family protein [Gallionella sp.]